VIRLEALEVPLEAARGHVHRALLLLVKLGAHLRRRKTKMGIEEEEEKMLVAGRGIISFKICNSSLVTSNYVFHSVVIGGQVL
jgi:hypothetical protein